MYKHIILTYFDEDSDQQKFDDPLAEVYGEPFSWGVDELLPDHLKRSPLKVCFTKDYENFSESDKSFEVYVSASLLREEEDGYIYESDSGGEFLVCHVIDLYFGEAPSKLYVFIDSLPVYSRKILF